MPSGVTPPPPKRSLHGVRRRIVHVVLFEGIAVAITTTVLALTTDGPVAVAGATAVVSSTIAMGWNWAWNALFERWESGRARKGRGFARRVAHAVGFELGLVVLLVPVFAWLLPMSLLESLLYNIGLVGFFIVYGFVFNLVFDRVFGLPLSATAQGSPPR